MTGLETIQFRESRQRNEREIPARGGAIVYEDERIEIDRRGISIDRERERDPNLSQWNVQSPRSTIEGDEY